MTTYLLAWNPKRWEWKTLADDCAAVSRGCAARQRWSCGKNKGINEGSPFFLIRLGSEPKGIIGAGRIASSPYEDLHWDSERSKAGERALFVDIDFELLSLNPLIGSAELHKPPLAGFRWETQMSGIEIRSPYAEELEKRWSFISVGREIQFSEEVTTDSTFYEGAVRKVQVNIYERDPAARKACIRSYGARCSVCGFDFEKTYGSIGAGFIHIHHLVPLSRVGKSYSVDPVRDLRPVCPNCHAVIHLRRNPYTVEEVKLLMRNAK